MYRVRFHGRGGQGIKTSARILGSAFFREGFEVQDAPVYGAERRGAPMFAYVRAAAAPIGERGAINQPDLVIVADGSLLALPEAAVLAGVMPRTVLLINTEESADDWQHRLGLSCPMVTLGVVREGATQAERRYVGASCAGAAARLVGTITRDSLVHAIHDELEGLGREIVAHNLERALGAYEAVGAHAGIVPEGTPIDAQDYSRPDWIDLPADRALRSAPAIHAAATSEQVQTGAWRTQRPIVDLELCRRCTWVCSTFCPDSVIQVSPQGWPTIDYEHCKGCLICVVVCPAHAIAAVTESTPVEQSA